MLIFKDWFIDSVKARYKNKYFYGVLESKRGNELDDNEEVEIFCPEHGLFKQKPKDHLKSAVVLAVWPMKPSNKKTSGKI